MPCPAHFSAHIVAAFGIFLMLNAMPAPAHAQEGMNRSRPNIVFILADDLGYGDVHALNADSAIPTPHLDQLAADGMTFIDAHSPSAVCTPTRYGLLTGRYCWRSRLKSGVLGGYSPPLIEADRMTVASMLRNAGYHTAAFGKWHLGMNMPRRGDDDVQSERWDGDGNVDFAGKIANGPTTRGFEHFFGVSASLDMAPYVWIEDERFTMMPSAQQPAQAFPGFVRKGPRSYDFVLDDVLDKVANRACQYITDHAGQDSPFFVYLPLTAPHKPVQPHSRFRGMTELGTYADFIVQVDDTVGRVLQSIEASGIRENTLVIFTSDNGSFMRRLDSADAHDHVDDESIQAFRADRHRANGPWRGTKADVWEAGHHVPFFARWPGVIEQGSVCERTVTHTDFFATAAEIVGARLPDAAAEDSFSWLPSFKQDPDTAARAAVINHSANGMFAIRDGRWKLVLGNGSGGRQQPRGRPFEQPYHLFDLAADPGETTNLAEQHAEVVARLTREFEEIRDSGRSRK